MTIREWLQQAPEITDLIEVDKERGVYTHSYEAIVRKLFILCPDGWDTRNFQHQYALMSSVNDESGVVIKVSGSIEVVVGYMPNDILGEPYKGNIVPYIQRTLTGAATFSTTDYSNETENNEHFAATLKSLCIVNAVQTLGVQFGLGLNSTVLPTQQVGQSKFSKKGKVAVRVDPNEGIRIQWNEAVEKKNKKKISLLLAMYNIPNGSDGYHFVNIEDGAA